MNDMTPAIAETEQSPPPPKNIRDLQKGDMVAVIRVGWHQAPKIKGRFEVSHRTPTRVTVDGNTYSLKGIRIGDNSPTVMAGLTIQVWNEEKHGAALKLQRAAARLEKSRNHISGFDWTRVTQEQANAVLDVMAAQGLILAPEAKAVEPVSVPRKPGGI